jgi:glycosyltransferase involved in cell wall biosynthesis
VEKVLIIAYFYPPCNLTASQRAFSWAKYLSTFGYYPVIITRRWDHKINSLPDVSRATPNELTHEVNDNYEVYYLPYKPNLRDRIYVKYGAQKFAFLRRLLTLGELLLQNFFTSVIPYSNLFAFAEEVVKKDKHIKKAIVTGNPFNLFKAGYNLNKKYGVKWIADYRDAWTTSEINFIDRSAAFSAINKLDMNFEKKWVASAALVTASSGPIAENITALTGVQSSALYNGFVKNDFDDVPGGKFPVFTITYVGTLYAGQKIEIFCAAFKRLVDDMPGLNIKLYFPGLAFYKDQETRINMVMRGYEPYFECTPRIERLRILEIEKKSHLLLHVAWDEQKGIIASKIYEYIASGSFIIVTPSDKGSIQEIVDHSGCGVCTDTVDETFAFLKSEYNNFTAGNYRINNVDSPEAGSFSRENQVKHLAQLLNRI